MGFFDKFKKGLENTRKNLVFAFSKIDDEVYEELEEILIMADVGAQTTCDIIDKLKNRIREEKITDGGLLPNLIKEIISDIMKRNVVDDSMEGQKVILVIGVNGVGKTTTIGKLANYYKNQGKNVILAAADTFRAAAIDQLSIWADRVGVQIIKQQEGTDPAAVVFDAVNAARARKADVLICDTAGRLHNKKNLMDELAKISRVIDKELPDAHKESLLVLDATTGQNAVVQARLFGEAAPIGGVALTKLDGTAKGGIIIAIKKEQDIPVKFIGVGEQIDDLIPFDEEYYLNALFGE